MSDYVPGVINSVTAIAIFVLFSLVAIPSLAAGAIILLRRGKPKSRDASVVLFLLMNLLLFPLVLLGIQWYGMNRENEYTLRWDFSQSRAIPAGTAANRSGDFINYRGIIDLDVTVAPGKRYRGKPQLVSLNLENGEVWLVTAQSEQLTPDAAAALVRHLAPDLDLPVDKLDAWLTVAKSDDPNENFVTNAGAGPRRSIAIVPSSGNPETWDVRMSAVWR